MRRKNQQSQHCRNDYSLVNLSFFHDTIDINQFSYLGPFIDFHWFNFDAEGLSLTAGFEFNLQSNEVIYYSDFMESQDKLVTRFLDLKIGCQYMNSEYSFYANANIDLYILVPLTMMVLKGYGEDRQEEL